MEIFCGHSWKFHSWLEVFDLNDGPKLMMSPSDLHLSQFQSSHKACVLGSTVTNGTQISVIKILFTVSSLADDLLSIDSTDLT